MRILMRFGVIALVLTCTTLGAQTPGIQVRGPRSVTLSADDMAAMPRTTVNATVRGQDTAYEGVAIREILTRAGVPTGDALRGEALAAAVLVTGADGYRVVFGIAELDPAMTDRVAILADRRDGVGLTEHEGPYQLVITGEKRPSRWVRQVVSIEVESLGR